MSHLKAQVKNSKLKKLAREAYLQQLSPSKNPKSAEQCNEVLIELMLDNSLEKDLQVLAATLVDLNLKPYFFRKYLDQVIDFLNDSSLSEETKKLAASCFNVKISLNRDEIITFLEKIETLAYDDTLKLSIRKQAMASVSFKDNKFLAILTEYLKLKLLDSEEEKEKVLTFLITLLKTQNSKESVLSKITDQLKSSTTVDNQLLQQTLHTRLIKLLCLKVTSSSSELFSRVLEESKASNDLLLKETQGIAHPFFHLSFYESELCKFVDKLSSFIILSSIFEDNEEAIRKEALILMHMQDKNYLWALSQFVSSEESKINKEALSLVMPKRDLNN